MSALFAANAKVRCGGEHMGPSAFTTRLMGVGPVSVTERVKEWELKAVGGILEKAELLLLGFCYSGAAGSEAFVPGRRGWVKSKSGTCQDMQSIQACNCRQHIVMLNQR